MRLLAEVWDVLRWTGDVSRGKMGEEGGVNSYFVNAF